jgi:hypothetical protein
LVSYDFNRAAVMTAYSGGRIETRATDRGADRGCYGNNPDRDALTLGVAPLPFDRTEQLLRVAPLQNRRAQPSRQVLCNSTKFVPGWGKVAVVIVCAALSAARLI